jgi:threonine dehydrogenase-like Zn-dependent dehydrogenase
VGNPKLNFAFLPSLRTNGIVVFTGIPHEHVSVQVEAGSLFSHLVLKNQVLFGSVNASKEHWRFAIRDLEEAQRRWDHAVSQIVTAHVPFNQFKDIFCMKPIDEIKTVLTWDL